MANEHILETGKKIDWLDQLLIDQITIPGDKVVKKHTLLCMGENGILSSIYIRTLSGKRLEFNYEHAVLFAKQKDLIYEEPGQKIIELSENPIMAEFEYSKLRDVTSTDAYNYHFDPFFRALKYSKKPDDTTVQCCTEMLKYINEKLMKASTIQGIYDSGVERHDIHEAYLAKHPEEPSYSKPSVAMSIKGAGIDAPGCVCMFLNKKEEALEWISRTRKHYFWIFRPDDISKTSLEELRARYKQRDEFADQYVGGIRQAIETNTVEAYFQQNYERNKAFIEEHSPFRLPEKWDALVKQ